MTITKTSETSLVRPEVLFSGLNSELRVAMAAYVIGNDGQRAGVEVEDIHTTLYKSYGLQAALGTKYPDVVTGETRQHLQRLSEAGLYAYDGTDDTVRITDDGLVAACAGGLLLEKSLPTGIALLHLVGYTAFSDRYGKMLTNMTVFDHVDSNPETMIPAKTFYEEMELDHVNYPQFHKSIKKLGGAGLLKVVKKPVDGMNSGRDVTCFSGPELDSVAGRDIGELISEYAKILRVFKSDPYDLHSSIDSLLDLQERVKASGNMSTVLMRSINAAGKHGTHP
jgi:hypothetical protein